MAKKLQNPSIRANEPWADDLLDRRNFGEALASMIEGIEQPFVVSVKGEWGSGKSVFLRRLEAALEGGGPRIPVIFIDAWKYDYYEDPLYALVSAIEQRLAKEDKDRAGKDSHAAEIGRHLFGTAAKVVAPLAKIAGATADMVTGGAITTLAEGVGELGDALLKANQEKRDAHTELRERLEQTRDRLLRLDGDNIPRAPGGAKVVVIIDELDRCRPDYAIKLLERVKHFFEIPGYLFVIAVDGQNIHEAVRTLYGPTVDGERYLRKFFDLEMYLPDPDTYKFNRLLRGAFGVLNEVGFDENKWKQVSAMVIQDGGLAGASSNNSLIEASVYFEVIASAFDLRLRDQAQAYSRLHATVAALGGKSYFMPFVAALIVCLRYHDHEKYEAWRLRREIPRVEQGQDTAPFIGLISAENEQLARALRHYFLFAALSDLPSIKRRLEAIVRNEQLAAAVGGRLPGNIGAWPRILEASYVNVFALGEMMDGGARA